MRRLLLVAAALAACSAAAWASAADVTLQNVHGNVTYETHDNAPPRALAPKAVAAIANDDVARTAAQSMAAIILPDSSVLTMGSESVLKVDTAAMTQETPAHIVVFNGKMRFKIEHPNGARANYVFTTPTGQLAVRGTEGDIAVDPLDGVRINVYSAAIPLHVTMIDGSEYDVPPGQKIWMRWESGKLIARVTPLTKAELDRFAEFGPPAAIAGGPPKI